MTQLNGVIIWLLLYVIVLNALAFKASYFKLIDGRLILSATIATMYPKESYFFWQHMIYGDIQRDYRERVR